MLHLEVQHVQYVSCILLFTEKIAIRLNKKDSRVTLTFEGMSVIRHFWHIV